jgi:hypothetical protein
MHFATESWQGFGGGWAAMVLPVGDNPDKAMAQLR